MKTSWTGLRDAFRELASQKNGIGHDELVAMGYPARQVVNNMRHMVDREDVVVVGYRSERRYFTDKQAAEFYRDVALPAIKAKKVEARNVKRRKPPKQRAVKSEPTKKNSHKFVGTPQERFRGKGISVTTIAGYTGQKWAKDKPIDGYHPEFKFTVCPAPAEFGPAAKIRGIGT